MDTFRQGFQKFKCHFLKKPDKSTDHQTCQFKGDKEWLNMPTHQDGSIKRPCELEKEIEDPPDSIDEKLLDRIQGSLLGLAVGDALGAHVEYRPREYLLAHPVTEMEGGGEWSLKKGEFTDNTAMALCLASSLLARRTFVPYDQLVRYKWWYRYGYMSSNGECFTIGAATRESLDEFINRQNIFAKNCRIPINNLDYLSDRQLLMRFNVECSKPNVAGTGALMRLAPVPLFFYQHIEEAIAFSGYSAKTTHGDKKAVDACRYYGALIIAALHNFTKDELLDRQFLEKHISWFGDTPICDEVRTIAEGSYQKQGGYDDGIRGRGYIVDALEAALWAFWSDENSFEKGVLAAVNLGDDTDTTAAIYGQLAGAFYGYKNLPKKWVNQICGHEFILKVGKWIAYEGQQWGKLRDGSKSNCSPSNMNRSVSYENISSNTMGKIFAMTMPQNHFDTVPTTKKSNRNTVFNSNSDLNERQNSMPTPSFSGSIDSNSTQNSTDEPKSPVDRSPHLFTFDQREFELVQAPESICKVPDSNHCKDWTCKDVCEWIRSLGVAYEVYIDGFERNNITGYRLLNLINRSALIEFGVDSLHHRQVILDGIEQLKKNPKPLSPAIDGDINNFYAAFDGDFVLPLYLQDSIYPDTKSCVLKPQQNKSHLKLYEQVLEWLGPLPSDIHIDKIELVHNADLYRMFLQQINRTERKQTQDAFQPHLDRETNSIERAKVLDRLQTITNQVVHNRTTSIARVWHGCKHNNVSPLVSDGFAALGKLDNGWYGKAMYFTSSAEYATRYTNSNGCLIMCYVILLNPFPVITDDAPPGVSSRTFRFYGRGNYANYQCHYIPVAPVDDQTLWNFRPPINGVEHATYDEFAIFQQADIFPQAIVHLKPANDKLSTVELPNEDSQEKFLSKEEIETYRV